MHTATTVRAAESGKTWDELTARERACFDEVRAEIEDGVRDYLATLPPERRAAAERDPRYMNDARHGVALALLVGARIRERVAAEAPA